MSGYGEGAGLRSVCLSGGPCGVRFDVGLSGGGAGAAVLPCLSLTDRPPADQRALGFSMRVERVGVDKVKERLMALKQKEEAAKTAVRESKGVERAGGRGWGLGLWLKPGHRGSIPFGCPAARASEAFFCPLH